MDDDILMHILTFILGFIAGLVTIAGLVIFGLALKEPEVESTELQQKYEEYVKENEWKNEYIEWLQDQLYEKYESEVQ